MFILDFVLLLIQYVSSLHFYNFSSYRVEGELQYEDIKGSHFVIHSQYFN